METHHPSQDCIVARRMCTIGWIRVARCRLYHPIHFVTMALVASFLYTRSPR